MNFNPKICEEAQEVIFSRRFAEAFHPTVFFNDIPVAYKHFSMYWMKN